MRILAALAFVTCAFLAWAAPGTTATERKSEDGKKTQWDGYQTWYHLTRAGRSGDPTRFLGNKDVEKGVPRGA